MPYIQDLDYKPDLLRRFTHLNTIATSLFRKVTQLPFQRHRLELEDGDFMDLDLCQRDHRSVAILVHGLEGDSTRPYMMGMARAFQSISFDTLSVNLRGCSGETNRLLKTYHSGSTDDLEAVINYVLTELDYDQIVLTGFSLGGNIVLKYTGDQAAQIAPQIKASIGISVPCDLTSCAVQMKQRKNFIYMRRFLNNLNEKVHVKKEMLLPSMDYEQLLSARNFHEFDHWFTAPANGYDSAAHYWETCSSRPVLSQVHVPTLLLSAQDDTFLGDTCYPREIAEAHDLFYLMDPPHGGHVGFGGDDRDGMLWSEYTVVKFIMEHLSL